MPPPPPPPPPPIPTTTTTTDLVGRLLQITTTIAMLVTRRTDLVGRLKVDDALQRRVGGGHVGASSQCQVRVVHRDVLVARRLPVKGVCNHTHNSGDAVTQADTTTPTLQLMLSHSVHRHNHTHTSTDAVTQCTQADTTTPTFQLTLSHSVHRQTQPHPHFNWRCHTVYTGRHNHTHTSTDAVTQCKQADTTKPTIQLTLSHRQTQPHPQFRWRHHTV